MNQKQNQKQADDVVDDDDDDANQRRRAQTLARLANTRQRAGRWIDLAKKQWRGGSGNTTADEEHKKKKKQQVDGIIKLDWKEISSKRHHWTAQRYQLEQKNLDDKIIKIKLQLSDTQKALLRSGKSQPFELRQLQQNYDYSSQLIHVLSEAAAVNPTTAGSPAPSSSPPPPELFFVEIRKSNFQYYVSEGYETQKLSIQPIKSRILKIKRLNKAWRDLNTTQCDMIKFKLQIIQLQRQLILKLQELPPSQQREDPAAEQVVPEEPKQVLQTEEEDEDDDDGLELHNDDHEVLLLLDEEEEEEIVELSDHHDVVDLDEEIIELTEHDEVEEEEDQHQHDDDDDDDASEIDLDEEIIELTEHDEEEHHQDQDHEMLEEDQHDDDEEGGLTDVTKQQQQQKPETKDDDVDHQDISSLPVSKEIQDTSGALGMRFAAKSKTTRSYINTYVPPQPPPPPPTSTEKTTTMTTPSHEDEREEVSGVAQTTATSEEEPSEPKTSLSPPPLSPSSALPSTEPEPPSSDHDEVEEGPINSQNDNNVEKEEDDTDAVPFDIPTGDDESEEIDVQQNVIDQENKSNIPDEEDKEEGSSSSFIPDIAEDGPFDAPTAEPTPSDAGAGGGGESSEDKTDATEGITPPSPKPKEVLSSSSAVEDVTVQSLMEKAVVGDTKAIDEDKPSSSSAVDDITVHSLLEKVGAIETNDDHDAAVAETQSEIVEDGDTQEQGDNDVTDDTTLPQKDAEDAPERVILVKEEVETVELDTNLAAEPYDPFTKKHFSSMSKKIMKRSKAAMDVVESDAKGLKKESRRRSRSKSVDPADKSKRRSRSKSVDPADKTKRRSRSKSKDRYGAEQGVVEGDPYKERKLRLRRSKSLTKNTVDVVDLEIVKREDRRRRSKSVEPEKQQRRSRSRSRDANQSSDGGDRRGRRRVRAKSVDPSEKQKGSKTSNEGDRSANIHSDSREGRMLIKSKSFADSQNQPPKSRGRSRSKSRDRYGEDQGVVEGDSYKERKIRARSKSRSKSLDVSSREGRRRSRSVDASQQQRRRGRSTDRSQTAAAAANDDNDKKKVKRRSRSVDSEAQQRSNKKDGKTKIRRGKKKKKSKKADDGGSSSDSDDDDIMRMYKIRMGAAMLPDSSFDFETPEEDDGHELHEELARQRLELARIETSAKIAQREAATKVLSADEERSDRRWDTPETQLYNSNADDFNLHSTVSDTPIPDRDALNIGSSDLELEVASQQAALRKIQNSRTAQKTKSTSKYEDLDNIKSYESRDEIRQMQRKVRATQKAELIEVQVSRLPSQDNEQDSVQVAMSALKEELSRQQGILVQIQEQEKRAREKKSRKPVLRYDDDDDDDDNFSRSIKPQSIILKNASLLELQAFHHEEQNESSLLDSTSRLEDDVASQAAAYNLFQASLQRAKEQARNKHTLGESDSEDDSCKDEDIFRSYEKQAAWKTAKDAETRQLPQLHNTGLAECGSDTSVSSVDEEEIEGQNLTLLEIQEASKLAQERARNKVISEDSHGYSDNELNTSYAKAAALRQIQDYLRPQHPA